MIETTAGWFETDQRNWRAFNAKKPAFLFVRKVLQNLLDLEPEEVRISVQGGKGGTTVELQCDSSGEFPHTDMPTSLFPSGRRDSHLYRGRQGKCLKQMGAVMDELLVHAKGVTVVVDPVACTTKVLKSLNKGGVTIEGVSSLWGTSTAAAISQHLSRVLVASDSRTRLVINGHVVPPKGEPVTLYRMTLPTLLYGDEGFCQTVPRKTEVRLYRPESDYSPHIHEMGVPVAQVKLDYHVDVSQRIPLSKKDGAVSEVWMRNFMADVLSKQVRDMEDRCLRL